MSNKISYIFTLSIMLTCSNIVADTTEAKELMDEANCLKCHNVSQFKARDEKVNSFKKLHQTVDRCAYNTKVQWFDDEKMDVVLYLNQDFYHFKNLDLNK